MDEVDKCNRGRLATEPPVIEHEDVVAAAAAAAQAMNWRRFIFIEKP